MNIFTLENDFYSISIAEKGAELKSAIHNASNTELIYNGNSIFWNKSSPILFPIVGRLKNDCYFYKGDTFSLSQHGFARDMNFELIEKTKDSLTLLLKNSSETEKNYPFQFNLFISYILVDKKIQVNYKVINLSLTELPFSLGAHPAFNCPWSKNETFEDFYLEFEKEVELNRHLLNLTSGNLTGETNKISLSTKILDLNYNLFKKDAIVLKNINSQEIRLKCKKSNNCLIFGFENFPYFGIWTKVKAPFICLEPWCGLADYENSSGNIHEKEGIILLNKNQVFDRKIEFSFQT